MATGIFEQDWKSSMYDSLHLMYPSLTEKQIYEELDTIWNESFTDRKSVIHNDYNDDMLLEQPLSLIYRFCHEKKPILAGNGTLFYNQDKISSPIADLIDDRITTRTNYKNEMKVVMDKIIELGDVESLTPEGRQKYNQLQIEYADDDRMQNEAKIRINSIYGSFGAKSFQLYNKYTAAATTGTGQSLISATGIAFEGFLADNVKFRSFGECIVFITNIVKEKYKLPVMSIRLITDVNEVYDRLVNNFTKGVFNETTHGTLLMDLLNNLTPSQLTKVYYKNNLFEFVSNECISSILDRAFHNIESFNNPNKIPKEIEEDLGLFWSYCEEYVFYNYHYTEQINRLKNDERKDVKLVDTDSNLVYVQDWVDFLKAQLNTDTMSMSGDSLDFACVNTIAYMITNMLKVLLKKYCNDAHVLERFHHRINMKNEFCFSKILFASVKKRYVGKIVLREGKPIIKYEIKGHDFKKAGVTEHISEKLENIIKTKIMDSPIYPVDTKGILNELHSIEKDIEVSLQNGERSYLVRMNCKDAIAYKNPYRMGQVLSVLVWNTVNPDNEIMVPDKLDVVLVNIPKEESLDIIKDTFPKEYKRLKENVFNGPLDVFRRKGIKYIAIPNSLDKIPDWIIPFIDYGYAKTRNLGTFRPILEALDLPMINSGDVLYFGNTVSNSNIMQRMLKRKHVESTVTF